MENLTKLLDQMDLEPMETKEQLKQEFCIEMVKFIETLEANGTVFGKTISQVYKTEIQQGNYIKAVDCYEYLQEVNY